MCSVHWNLLINLTFILMWLLSLERNTRNGAWKLKWRATNVLYHTKVYSLSNILNIPIPCNTWKLEIFFRLDTISVICLKNTEWRRLTKTLIVLWECLRHMNQFRGSSYLTYLKKTPRSSERVTYNRWFDLLLSHGFKKIMFCGATEFIYVWHSPCESRINFGSKNVHTPFIESIFWDEFCLIQNQS